MRYRILLTLLCLCTPCASRAEVVRIDVQVREPFADGKPFGSAGSYERLAGKIYLEVDPNAAANQRIVDLKLAPRNERGMVEFWTDFFLLKPTDPLRGNRRLLYDVNNRGNKLAMGAFNNAGGNDPKSLRDAGNGFLMRQGFSVLWCGWNGDVRPGNKRMLIGLPVAVKDGKPLQGKVYAELTVNSPTQSQVLYWGNSVPYPVVESLSDQASLTMRPNRASPPTPVAREHWSFARWEDGKVVPDRRHLYIEAGFEPGWLYDLVYTAEAPRITGLGFAAVRDVVSFFRYKEADRHEHDNPLAAAIEKAYIFGISQSGRFTHHLIHDGFNKDPLDQIVFDGALPHVAGGGKGMFNYRFAQTTRHGSQHEDNLFPSDFFPFTTIRQADPVTGAEGSTFARAIRAGSMPKVFFMQTSTEYWARAASLLHTDVGGTYDVGLHDDVRLYFFAGAQHGNSSSMRRSIYENYSNTLDHRALLRALLIAMDEWVTNGVAPPPSSHPKISDGTLISLDRYQDSFPKIPNVTLPDAIYTPLRLDWGPRWHTDGIADKAPPGVGTPYRTLVPAVDSDGNEVAGIRLPTVSVPLSTFTGWNRRTKSIGAAGMLARWSGSQWPLPKSDKQRQAAQDPRPSIRHRYRTHSDYVAQVARSALGLQRRRFLLDEDVVRFISEAQAKQELWSTEPESSR